MERAVPATVQPPTAPSVPPPAVAAAPAGPANPDAREFQGQARLGRTLRGAELQAAVVGDRLLIRVPAPPPASPAMATTFAIKTVATGGDASAFSNLVTAAPAPAPEPPNGLATTPRPNGVEVSWAPASPAPQAYRVYRRSAQARGYGEALHQSPANESSYVDTSAKLGERYVYTVAAVASATPLVLSPRSAESEVDYQDRFPPAAPAGLVALPEGTQVRLRWNASEAEDTAGYVVFRQDPGGEFHRVTSAPIAALEYLDSGLVAGNTYRYRVAAVDRSGNEGQPGDAVEGIVR
jgi:fibronectin type 3 domain-containing protein